MMAIIIVMWGVSIKSRSSDSDFPNRNRILDIAETYWSDIGSVRFGNIQYPIPVRKITIWRPTLNANPSHYNNNGHHSQSWFKNFLCSMSWGIIFVLLQKYLLFLKPFISKQKRLRGLRILIICMQKWNSWKKQLTSSLPLMKGMIYSEQNLFNHWSSRCVVNALSALLSWNNALPTPHVCIEAVAFAFILI